MARYNYACGTCTLQDALDKDLEGPFYISDIEKKPDKLRLIWEEKHGMMEDPEISCPICGTLCKKTMAGTWNHSLGCGDGYLDSSGTHRVMNLHKLMNDDPYGHMRQPGEKEDLAQKLRNGGKHGYDRHGNRKTKYFS